MSLVFLTGMIIRERQIRNLKLYSTGIMWFYKVKNLLILEIRMYLIILNIIIKKRVP